MFQVGLILLSIISECYSFTELCFTDITYLGSPVVFAPAWHSGHNGDVYFATSSVIQKILLQLQVYLISSLLGLHLLKSEQVPALECNGLSFEDSRVTFENCHIIGRGFWWTFNF